MVLALVTSLCLSGVATLAQDIMPDKSKAPTTSPKSAPPAASTKEKASKVQDVKDKESKDAPQVIGYLEKRDRVITIKASEKGPVYSVATKEGKVLFENVSAEQLKAQAPEIHDLIKNAYATDASTKPMKTGAVRVNTDASDR